LTTPVHLVGDPARVTVDEFRQAVEARGGHAEVWVVCIEDAHETRIGGGFALVPHAAFWTRGDAYSAAHARHAAVTWHHAYVFRLIVDSRWAAGTEARDLEFETVFTAASGEPRASLTPAAAGRLLSA
jgi:hypothetical protein